MNKITMLLALFIAAGSLSYGQSLNFSDPDDSGFPILKAKFFAVDPDGKQVKSLSPNDFTITENDIPRNILSVSCPKDKPPDNVSLTLIIDRSRSMEGSSFKIAKMIAKIWINALPLNSSECAITTFDDRSYLAQNFSSNPLQSLNTIDEITASDGTTNYDEALIEPPYGGVLIAKEGKYKRIIVFITDGEINKNPAEDRIIEEAKRHNITIHCITIKLPAHSSIKRISSQTDGLWFEKVETEEQAEAIAKLLLVRSVFGDPCEISWRSELSCKVSERRVVALWNGIAASAAYYPPPTSLADISIAPYSVTFFDKPIGIKADTTINISSINSDIKIEGFNVSNPLFTVSPPSLIIKKGDTQKVVLSFTPQDSVTRFTSIGVKYGSTDGKFSCEQDFFAKATYPYPSLGTYNLKVTFPNGGEKIVVGSDTLVKWSGLFQNDSVTVDYSADSGRTWRLLSNTASGFNCLWKNVTKPVSDHCLVRVSTNRTLNEPHTLFEKKFGGSKKDVINSVKQTTDGKLIAVGQTNSRDIDSIKIHGETDAWVGYFSADGKSIWENCIGGRKIDLATSVVESYDGGFIIGGETSSSDGDLKGNSALGSDFWIAKTDVNGAIIKSATYGGSGDERSASIDKTLDGGLILAGRTNSKDKDISENHGLYDAWVAKLDDSGVIEWQKSFGGKADDGANSIIATSDGGFLVAGYTSSNDGTGAGSRGLSDGMIIKLSRDGSTKWVKLIGGAGADTINSVIETADGGFAFAGTSTSDNGDVPYNRGKSDAFIGKLNRDGSIEWTKSIGGSRNDRAQTIIQTFDNNYVFVGTAQSNDGDVNRSSYSVQEKFWAVKYDPAKGIKWQKVFNNPLKSRANCICETYDLGCVAVGDVIDKDSSDFSIKKFEFDFPPQIDESDSLFSIVAPKTKGVDVDMGKVVVGYQRDSVVSAFIENVGAYDCKIESISIIGANSSNFRILSDFHAKLKASERKEIEFRFIPDSPGIREASIEVLTQDSLYYQKISGVGVKPVVELLVDTVDFGTTLTGTTKDTTLYIIRNSSDGIIDVAETKLTGVDSSRFEIVIGGGSFILNKNEKRELKIIFKPLAIGSAASNIEFVLKEIRPAITCKLVGEGIGAAVSLGSRSAYAGDKFGLDMLYACPMQILPDSARSFKAKIRYLKAPLEATDKSLIVEETADSAVIEIAGEVGADKRLAVVQFVALDAPVKTSSLDLIDFRWYDKDGSEIAIVTEKHGGEFNLSERRSSAHVAQDSAYPGQKVNIRLILNNAEPTTLPAEARSIRSKIRYLKGPLELMDRSLLTAETADSAIIEVTAQIIADSVLCSVPFICKFSDVKYTSIDILEYKWLDKEGKEIKCKNEAKSGFFRTLSLVRNVNVSSDSAYAGESVIIRLIQPPGKPREIYDPAKKFHAKIRYQRSLLALKDKSLPILLTEDSAIVDVSGPIGEDSVLYRLNFIAGLGKTEATSLDLLEFVWIDENDREINYETVKKSGVFTLLGICREGGPRLFNPSDRYGILNVSPNPAGERITVVVNKIEECEATISIFNILGGEVGTKTIYCGVVGLAEVTFDLSAFSQGVYYVYYKTPTYSSRKKFVIK